MIFNCNLAHKGIRRKTSMEEFKLENNKFGAFVHVPVIWISFF